jgi:hypothetical protein
VVPSKGVTDNKRGLLEAGMTSATVARRLSVLRGAYRQLAAKGLVSWETAQDIAAVKAPGVQKNATPSLMQKQAVALLEAIPTDTLQGIRDLALMSVFFLNGCRVSAVTVALEAHHTGKNHHRRYQITVGRDLLDAWTVAICYGRAGQGGRELRYASPQPEEMRVVIRDGLRSRLLAPKQIGCAYQLAAFSVAPGFDALAWLPGGVMARFFQSG